MGGFSNFAISFSIISILTGAVILYNYGLAWAGRRGRASAGRWSRSSTCCIAASMAEIASAYPTAGGLYYWASRTAEQGLGLVDRLAQPRRPDLDRRRHQLRRRLLHQRDHPSRRSSDFDPNAETVRLDRTRSGSTGLLMLVEIGFNIAGTKIVATMNDISVWWHIGLVIAIAVALFVLGSQPTHPIDFLFTIAPGSNADGRGLGATSSHSGSPERLPSASFSRSGRTPAMTPPPMWPRRPFRRGPRPPGASSCRSRVARSSDISSWSRLTLQDDDARPTILANSTGGGGVASHPRDQPRRRTRPARWPAGRRDRRRDDVLRLLLDRVGRPDAVCVQPR